MRLKPVPVWVRIPPGAPPLTFQKFALGEISNQSLIFSGASGIPKVFGICSVRGFRSWFGHQPVIAPMSKKTEQIAAGIAQIKLSAHTFSEKPARMTAIAPRNMRSLFVVEHRAACNHLGIGVISVFRFLFGDLFANFIHVKFLNSLNQFTKLVVIECAWLSVNQNTLPERHQGRNGTDAETTGELLFSFGVDFAKHNVSVGFGGLLKHRRKHPARSAPAGPKIEEYDLVVVNGLFVVAHGDFNCAHCFSIPPGV